VTFNVSVVDTGNPGAVWALVTETKGRSTTRLLVQKFNMIKNASE
jgi:hypothetical protein